MKSIKLLKKISKELKSPLNQEDFNSGLFKHRADVQISAIYKKYKSSSNIYEELTFRWVLAIIMSWRKEDDHGHWHFISCLYENNKSALSQFELRRIFKDVKLVISNMFSIIRNELEVKLQLLYSESSLSFQRGLMYQGMFIQKDIVEIRQLIEKLS